MVVLLQTLSYRVRPCYVSVPMINAIIFVRVNIVHQEIADVEPTLPLVCMVPRLELRQDLIKLLQKATMVRGHLSPTNVWSLSTCLFQVGLELVRRRCCFVRAARSYDSVCGVGRSRRRAVRVH